MNLLKAQVASLLARKARFDAELNQSEEIAFPGELTGRKREPFIALVIEQEKSIFMARREALATQIHALNQLKTYLEKEIVSLEGQLKTEDDQIRILAQLMQQIEYAAAAAQPGRPSDPQQAGRALGMSNPNRMRHVLRAASDSRVPPAQLLDIALEADRRIKRGLDPEPVDALYSLILGSPERRAG